jgi:hypothetical protein
VVAEKARARENVGIKVQKLAASAKCYKNYNYGKSLTLVNLRYRLYNQCRI